MQPVQIPIQRLISLPPAMAVRFESLERRARPDWFAASDPVGTKLGSGGGTAHLLHAAWQASSEGASFRDWLRASRKLIIHGGGESRRMPAYATTGKPLMPIPAMRWSRGQRLDQTLLDLQLPSFERVLSQAPANARVLISSGDVLLRFGRDLPAFPEVDVLGLGMWITPERAKDFGVFFVPRGNPTEWAFFLQKPSPARIRELAADFLYLVDTGLWLLSEAAVELLMTNCGWDAATGGFADGTATRYELYEQMGFALGSQPTKPDPVIGRLSCAVLPLPEPEFLHFGTSRQCIESVSALQNRVLDETKLGAAGARRHPDQYLQNADFRFPLRREQNHTLWVENAAIPETWQLAHEHILTGIPANDWSLRLDPGACLDFVPVGEVDQAIRFHGIDDRFRGAMGDPATRWLGRPASNWFFARGLDREACGIASETDIFAAPLFPVLKPDGITGGFVEWLLAAEPAASEEHAARWRESPRLSARDLLAQVNVDRLYARRAELRQQALAPMLRNARWSVFLKLDLDSTARLYAASANALPAGPTLEEDLLDPLGRVHEHIFRATVRRLRRDDGWEKDEREAFARLGEIIIREATQHPARPRCTVQEDQIVWGRSPVRLDLAGGWSDTPPYCLENGGRVLNVAVDLNGQPPIQVYARRAPERRIVLRSIDLGAEERITTYAELERYADPGSGFAVARAALALAGFLPRFRGPDAPATLVEALEAFGGGIELSLLAAVPKGSGLGTSSILAAAVLGTLSDLCELGWDRHALFGRTMALEQMLTTGGGWQDQGGGIFRGTKLIETAPGLDQSPTLRWVPDHLLDGAISDQVALLYYTGITRMAKNILGEIVRGIFLNSPAHLDLIDAIAENAGAAFDALQRGDYGLLTRSVRTSWDLNQRLDAGTNPPEVEAILAQVRDWLAAAKLLGAGGGGFLLMFAKDAEAARRIRVSLTRQPPNARARFVSFAVSPTGLHITRS